MLSSWITWCCVTTTILVLHVSADNMSCPTAFYYDSETQQCECVPLRCSVQCNQQKKIAEICNGCCVTYTGSGSQYYSGECPLRYKVNSTNRMYAELPTDPDMLNKMMCGPYNRQGFLCGSCIDGYGPAVYSLDMKCSNCSKLSIGSAVSLYLFLEFIPITFLFLLVTIFHFNITSGPLLGYVIFCQVFTVTLIKSNNYIYDYILSDVSTTLNILLDISVTICKTFNFELLKPLIPSFCISNRLTDIHIQMLSLVKTIYPIVLVIITCILMELHARNYRIIHILCKPFVLVLNKINITVVISDSVIHAFATVILMCSTNIVYALYTLTQMTNAILITNSTVSSYRNILYFDLTVVFYSRDHILYLVLAAIPTLFLVLIPAVLLCVYPTSLYAHHSQFISARKRLAITAFAEALHKCFKDGLNGTRDYRGFAGLVISAVPVYTIITYLLWSLVTPNYRRELICGYCLLVTALLLLFSRPCKSMIANISLIYHSAMLGVIFITIYLWENDFYIPTRRLELKFIIIPFISHVLVLIWAGYSISHYIWIQCSNSSSLTLENVKTCSCFNRRRGDYQEIHDITTT